MMYELEKSDSLVVPRKSANKAGLLAAEPMEGSGGIARNAHLQRTARTQSRTRRVTRADRHTCGCGCIGCASSTRDRSRMREFRSYGSVRGAPSNGRPYRKNRPVRAGRPTSTFDPELTVARSRSRDSRSFAAQIQSRIPPWKRTDLSATYPT